LIGWQLLRQCRVPAQIRQQHGGFNLEAVASSNGPCRNAFGRTLTKIGLQKALTGTPHRGRFQGRGQERAQLLDEAHLLRAEIP